MHIGVDARPLNVPLTGIGRYTKSLLKRLLHDSSHTWHLYSVHPIVDAIARLPNVRTRSIGTSTSRQRRLAQVMLHATFPRWAATDGLDLFWSPRHQLPLLNMQAKQVTTIHDFAWRTVPQTMPKLRVIAERLFTPPSLRSADRIIAVSESTKQEIIAAYPGHEAKITVVLEASEFANSQGQATGPTKDPFILFVGTIEPRKNLPRLLDAYAQARCEAPALPRLLVVGKPGWKLPPMEQLIAKRKLEAHVVYQATCTDVELAKHYAACSFLLLPSLHEGFALPLVEAMMFAKPAVTSNRSAMPEVAGDSALLVDPTSTAAISRAIIRLAQDQQLYRQLARNAARRSTYFSWDQAAVETLGVLEAAAAS